MVLRRRQLSARLGGNLPSSSNNPPKLECSAALHGQRCHLHRHPSSQRLIFSSPPFEDVLFRDPCTTTRSHGLMTVTKYPPAPSLFFIYSFIFVTEFSNNCYTGRQDDETGFIKSIYFSFLEDNGEGKREISPTIQIIVLRMEHKNTRRRGKRSELGFSRRITSVESTLSPRLCFLWILHQLRSQGREVPRPFHAVSIFPPVFQDSIESSCWKYIIESSTSR